MKIGVFLAAWLWAAQGEAQVSGRITDTLNGEPVSHATVVLHNARDVRSTATVASGEYSFSGSFVGEYRLRVHHPGYEETDLGIVLTAGNRVVIDLALRTRPVGVDTFRIKAGRTRLSGWLPEGHPDSIGRRPLALDAPQLATMPGGTFADLGLERPARGPSASDKDGHPPQTLQIWGSGAGHGRVTLDGAPLGAPLHLGRMLPPIAPQLLDGVEVSSGGADARRDGGAMYLVDFATRPARADGFHASAKLDLLAAQGVVEVPLNDEGSLLFGARRVNDELAGLLAPGDFDYAYHDALLRADWHIGHARLRATAWSSREAVLLPRDLERDQAAWANHAFSAAAHLGQSGSTHLLASFSRGLANLPLLSAPGGRVDAGVDRILASMSHEARHGVADLTGGMQIEQVRFFRRSSGYPGGRGTSPDRSRCTATLPCSEASGHVSAVYANALIPIGSRATVRAGARVATLFRGNVHVLPRLEFTRTFGGFLSVNASAGRFSQTVAGYKLADAPEEEVDDVALLQANHLQLEAVAQLAIRSRIGLTAFSRGGSNAGFQGGPAQWTGIELAAVHKTDPLDVHFIYSASRQQNRSSEPVTWLLRGVLNTEAQIRWLHAAASVQFGNGIPVTSIVLDQPAPPGRIDPIDESLPSDTRIHGHGYLRIDASVGAEWVVSMLDQTFVVLPYARIVNASNADDALFFFENPASPGAPQPLASLPSLPVIGFGIRF